MYASFFLHHHFHCPHHIKSIHCYGKLQSRGAFQLFMATPSAMDSKRTIAVSGDGAREEDPIGKMDHGVHAWTVVIGAWCCLFCGFGWVNGENCLPPHQSPIFIPTVDNLIRLMSLASNWHLSRVLPEQPITVILVV